MTLCIHYQLQVASVSMRYDSLSQETQETQASRSEDVKLGGSSADYKVES